MPDTPTPPSSPPDRLVTDKDKPAPDHTGWHHYVDVGGGAPDRTEAQAKTIAARHNADAAQHDAPEQTGLQVDNVFAGVPCEYETRTLTDPATGEVFDFTVPVAWSDQAATILATKYARKTGVGQGVPPWAQSIARDPHERKTVVDPGGETHARQLFARMAGAWAHWGYKLGYFDIANAETFRREIEAMLEQQVAAPNSPQWFNTGLHWAYGIEGKAQGHYAAETTHLRAVYPCPDAYVRPQVHACFIQSVDDDLVGPNGIMDLMLREARLFKFGSGTGTNYSSIRAKGEPLAGGGTSSGLLSFLRVSDRSAGAIKSGGTTRRAARMVVLDVDHPDIEDFIAWKPREEVKVRALRAAGIGDEANFEDEATETVSGQNGNNSVRVTDDFMRAVANDDNFDLTWRTSGEVARTVEARDVWGKICEAAHACADPGLQFSDTINRWHTCAADEPIRGSNPCQPGFAKVLTPDGVRTFDDIDVGSIIWSGKQWTTVTRKTATGTKQVHAYHTSCGAFVGTAEHRVFEAGIRVEAQYAAAIDQALVEGDTRSPEIRTITHIEDLGVHDVFDITVAADEHSYWTDGLLVSNCSEYMFVDDTACNLASINLVKCLRPDMTVDVERYQHAVRLWTIVLDISVSMAGYPSETIARKSMDYRTLGLGYANLGGALMRKGIAYDSDEGREWCSYMTSMMGATSWQTSAELAKLLGSFPAYERNASALLSVMIQHADAARVGADEASQAWVRAYAAVQDYGARNAQCTLLAPTGTISFVMDCDTTGIEPVYALKIRKRLAGGGYMEITCPAAEAYIARRRYDSGARVVYEPDDPVLTCANDINWRGHLGMMAAAQPFLCGAISKTVNMPSTATADDISDVYTSAWDLGLKAVAVYRDKSKATQVLTTAAVDDFETRQRERDQHKWDQYVDDKPSTTVTKQASSLEYSLRGTETGRTDSSAPNIANGPRSTAGGALEFTNAESPVWDNSSLTVVNAGAGESIRRSIQLPDGQVPGTWGTATTPGTTLPGTLAAATLDQYIEYVAKHAAGEAERLNTVHLKRPDDGVSFTYDGRTAELPRGQREAPPALRSGNTARLKIAGQSHYITVNRYPDGRVCEIFCHTGKAGGTVRGWVDCFAVAVSFALQHGTPLRALIDKLRYQRFEPAGFVTDGPLGIKQATSPADGLAQLLDALETLDAPPPPAEPAPVSEPVSAPAKESTPVHANAVCENCRSTNLQAAGSCFTCRDCGATTGCG